MRRVLACWIGDTDLRAPASTDPQKLGPIASAVAARQFDEILLLSDRDIDAAHRLRDGAVVRVDACVAWLKERAGGAAVTLRHQPLSGPTNFGDIYQAAKSAVEAVRGAGVELTFHLSPGTPAMGAVWIILAKTVAAAELIESSPEHGVKTVDFPFELSADFVPDLLRSRDQALERLAVGQAPEAPEFAAILHRSDVMKGLVARARRVALRSVPVLIEGESGTGKELLARAIHRASPRRDGPLVVVNCGAIPPDLAESELFGHKRGAFTGAAEDRAGHFEAASGGTVFLDEVGELPLTLQVKLLRVLEEHHVVRIGTSKPIPVDVRVIAATNLNLLHEIAARRFREDLFYRLAVALMRLPSLRERPGDVGYLLDRLLGQVNLESEREPGFVHKKLSAGARSLLLRHPWPGNVRELLNTLRRAAVWSEGATIEASDVREALLVGPTQANTDVLGRPLGDGLNLPELMDIVARHYLERAMKEAGGNKTKAAELVGLPSYQTLTNWLERYGLRSGHAAPPYRRRGTVR
jgi:DNA-binding NtrC family response regulator